MRITSFDKIICRTPAFGTNQTIKEVWEELKLKIEESSPDFYQIIKPLKSSDLNLLDDKTKFTIWKYFNRAKYRSTPFGSFSSITTLPLSFTEHNSVLIKNKMLPHHWIDWSQKEKHQSNSIANVRYFLSNVSIYFIEQEIRYIKTINGQFELAAINAVPEINLILLSCKRKTTPDLVYELMNHTFGIDKKSTIDLLQQLINLQLLHTDQQANITGMDYFSRLKIPFEIQASNYIIAERALLNGNFNGNKLKDLPEMIDFFTKNFNANQHSDLENFKKSFVKRFEHQEMSLTMAMDPEIGIGYGDLAQLSNNNQLVDDIKSKAYINTNDNINYGKLQQFLLKKIIANKAIDLAEFNTKTDKTAIIPNTFSLIFHLYKERPVLAYSGGSTANALLGRFTMCNKEIENYGKEIATLEMNANADVLFFDIAYQAEKKVDNVNRRKQLYHLELPILTWTETPESLDLNDILVAIERGEVVLKSKKLGKRIIPRIPSAYNYTRSDLAVYRFLCDIQSQSLLTSLSFKLQDHFPGLEHYPRVNFKEVIVSATMWLVPLGIFSNVESIKHWLNEKKINAMFKVGDTDQSLSFDPNNEEDLLIFFMYYKQQQTPFYITEALLDKSDFIEDEFNNKYSPQYIVNYKHEHRIYSVSSPKINQVSQVYLPGSEWLYFEIYCHPAKSNHLLINLINPFLKSKNHYIKEWFFIRYTDPKPHIRLRLHLKDINTGFEVLNAFKILIEPELRKGFVNDFKLETYHKETQRYGTKRMVLVEHFFCIDSKYALQLFKQSPSEDQLIANSINSIQAWLSYCFNDLEQQISFTKKMATNFAKEMDLSTIEFKKINAEFNLFKVHLENKIITLPLSIIKKQQHLLINIISNCDDDIVIENMVADLIHMHINRLFITNQRVYETIIYHYLLKMLQTKFATSKI